MSGNNDFETFSNLEILNAQIDVWIDEENFGDVDKTFSTVESSVRKELLEVFSDENTCADKNKDARGKILGDPFNPRRITEVLLAPDNGTSERKKSKTISPEWCHLFWATWIRGMIQKRGTDCYLRKLDHVIAYLERYMPSFDPCPSREKEPKLQPLERKKLVVLYLLEMAAAGLGPDHRSFAQRAKRFLDHELRDDGGTDNFRRFYVLVAEYHVAVGYFHERMPEKGEAAYLKIIRDLKRSVCGSQNMAQGNGTWQCYARGRLAQSLLYVPAVLGIAEARVKKQLAHSAIVFIREGFETCWQPPTRYQKIRKHLIVAEACLEMESMQGFEEEMQGLVDYLDHKEEACLGLASRVVPLVLDHNMQSMRRAHEQVTHDYRSDLSPAGKSESFRNFLDSLRKRHLDVGSFEEYWKIAENRKEDRQGFLMQLAEYCTMLVKEIGKDTWSDEYEGLWTCLRRWLFEQAKSLYRNAKWTQLMLPKNPREKSHSITGEAMCPCAEPRNIDLERTWSKDFIDYQKTMRDFFKEINNDKSNCKKLVEDEIKFLEAVQVIQKRDGEALQWMDREFYIRLKELRKSGSDFSCNQCLAHARRVHFSGLLECAQECSLRRRLKTMIGKGDRSHYLGSDDYDRIMSAWDNYFTKRVTDRSSLERTGRGIHFIGLQRWNSTSPAMGLSRGGGYFLFVTDESGDVELGIALDPGFNFVENLLHWGFSIADIDIVLLSHSHLDHVRDFESMVSLCFEAKKRTKKRKRHLLHTLMTYGTYDRLGHIFSSPELRYFVEPYLIDADKHLREESHKPLLGRESFPSYDFRCESGPSDSISRVQWGRGCDKNHKKCRVKITPVRAFHNDHSDMSDSFGFSIEIITGDERPLDIGYTGDTAWHGGLMGQFKGCDALLVHLGSLIGSKDGKRDKFWQYKKSGDECYNLVAKENHPYLPGLLHFLYDIKQQGITGLVLVSEFGEELRGGIRVDLLKRLNKACEPSVQLLPVDVGLDVRLWHNPDSACDRRTRDGLRGQPAVWCVQCEQYVDLKLADFETYGHDEALFCVCSTCRKSTPHNVLQDRLRRLYEEGRSLPQARERPRQRDKQYPEETNPFSCLDEN